MSPAEHQAIVDSYDLLYSLGATANHLGFFQTACAVRLAAQQPERLLLVTKWLYPEVAKHYHTNWRAVERNIGARGLRAILEEVMTKVMYEIPSDPTIVKVTITPECVTQGAEPELQRNPDRVNRPRLGQSALYEKA